MEWNIWHISHKQMIDGDTLRDDWWSEPKCEYFMCEAETGIWLITLWGLT